MTGTGGLSGSALSLNGTVTNSATSSNITVSSTALTGFTYVAGAGPSVSQTYNLSGSNLTPAAGNLTVTGSTNYQVSLSTDMGFGSSVTVPYTGGTRAATPIYVRLKAGLAAADYNSETIGNVGGGATAANVTGSGNVTAAPTPNPVPTISSLLPNTAVAGGAGFALSVAGTNFVPGATATFGGVSRAVTYVSATQLTVAVIAADITAEGTYDVVITNPAPGGGTSAAATFTVTAPAGGSTCLSEGFEATTFPPTGWIATTVSRSADAADVKNGNGAVIFPGNDIGSLTTPMLANPVSLTFFLGRSSNNNAKTLAVQVATDGQAGTFTPIATFDHSNVPSASYNQYTVNLSAYAASPQVWIRFVKSGATPSPWRFDDVAVTCGAAVPLAAEPTIQPTITATNPTTGTIDLTLSGGDGVARLVVVRPTAAASAAPADGIAYAANAAYGSGSSTGTGNFVVLADASTTSLTVSGLTPATSYTVSAYAYNGSGSTANYLTTSPGTATFSTQAAPPYTWIGMGGTANWSTAANWSPARTTPAATDVLVFNGSVTPTATITLDFTGSAQIIGQLRLLNSVNVTLRNTSGTKTLNLDGGLSGDDLTITSGSTLTLRGGTNGAGVRIDLTAGETALVGGTIISGPIDAAATTNANNRVTAQTNRAIIFAAGALYEVEPKISGNPFSDILINKESVVFQAGATFRQRDGANPFGLTQSAGTIVIFEPGSIYQYAVNGADSPSLSGRTVGTLELSGLNTAISDIASGNDVLLIIQNDLKVSTTSPVGLNLTNGIRIGGNIVVGAGAALSFAPASVSAVLFNGSQPQTTSGVGSLTFGSHSTLRLANPAGLELLAPVQVNGVLDLQNGVLTSSGTNRPTLASDATITGGSATSYVSGPLAQMLASGTTTARFFPVGKAGRYRPVTLMPTTFGASSTITAEQQEGLPMPLAFTAPIQRVSRLRRYDISASPALSAAQFAGTITLSFEPNDQVNNPAAASLIIARTEGTSWSSLGRSANTGTAGAPGTSTSGTLTSASFTGLAASQTYSLASTDPDVNNNPLPVQLLSFGAERQGPAVRLRWATATELNAARFEVQRSATGQEFQIIATVAAQGNSNTRHEYAATDAQPLPGRNYYRLRQLDLDGKAAYSAVVRLAAPGTARVYPNPAASVLTIEAPTEGGRYRLLSLTGRVVLEGELAAGLVQLNVATLPAGMYQLELTTPAGRDVHKIVKQ